MKITAFEFSLSSNFTLRELSRGMISQSFDENSSNGFRLDSVKRNSLSGSFFNRRTKRVTISNLDGTLEILSRESIERVEFILDSSEGLLIAFEPGFNTKDLISQIAIISRFNVTLEPKYENIQKFSKALPDFKNCINIEKIYLKEINFGDNISGILAAKGDLPKSSLGGIVGEIVGKVSKLQVFWIESEISDGFSVTISENGRLEILKCDSSKKAYEILLQVLALLK